MAKTNYKANVLDYLKNHVNEDITRDVLIKDTGISKSRLSEVINSIREDGYTIITPPRSGLIRFENNDNQLILQSIKDSDLRQWLIIFILSIYGPLTFREIVLKSLQIKDGDLYDPNQLLTLDDINAYDDNHIIKSIRKNKAIGNYFEDDIDVAKDHISITSLRKDLTSLRNQNIIQIKNGKHTKYELTSNTPFLMKVSDSSLFELCRQHEENLSTSSETVPVKEAFKKISTLIDYYASDTTQKRFGKQNQISKGQIEKFNFFISYPYKTNKLRLFSHIETNEIINTVSVGLIFYSVETGSFYALCQKEEGPTYSEIRLDFIDSIIPMDDKNEFFHTQKAYDIYDEIFATKCDEEVYHVKVLVQDRFNIPARFENIKSLRKNAKIRRINNPSEECIYDYVYEDDIRGLIDFARFLRTFGYSVLAVSPPELVNQMTFTYNRSLEKYSKIERGEYE